MSRFEEVRPALELTPVARTGAEAVAVWALLPEFWTVPTDVRVPVEVFLLALPPLTVLFAELVLLVVELPVLLPVVRRT